jgi:RNA polymerase sigma factor (sigma-70 family)
MATAQLEAVVRHIRGLAADPAASEQTDGALLRAFLAGNDQAAFEALLRRHGPMVLRACRRILGVAQDAEDAFQATFLVLAQQAHSIRKRESLASWLYGVVHRMATHAKRAAARRHKHESRASPAKSCDPALSAAWRELQALLDEEIERLPETLRAPFALCCLENQNCAGAAQQLCLQEGTVRKRLSRARKLLQQRLSRRGVSLTAVLAAATVGANGAWAAVPRSLVAATAKAAAQLTAGQALAGATVSANVISLVEGVNRAMFLTKCKLATLLLLGTALLGAGLGPTALRRAAAEPPPAPELPAAAAAEGPKPVRKPPAAAPDKSEARDVVKLRGRVLDPDGKPVAGAKLYLRLPNSGATTFATRATSGADGRFSFTVARSNMHNTAPDSPRPQVVAAARGHGCDWVETGSAKEELTLRLVKDVPIRGRILDPDGRPLPGAKLRITAVFSPHGDLGGYLAALRKGDTGQYAFAKAWAGPLPGLPAVLTTGADGRFTLAGVGRERLVRLHLEGPAITTAELEAMTRAGEKVGGLHPASFDFLTTASRPIRGVVRDRASRKPLAGVSVQPCAGFTPMPGRVVVTDQEGRYELLGLAKTTRYELLVKPAGGLYFERRTEFRDPPGLGPLTVDIDMVQGGVTVRGKITDKTTGKPVARARIYYYPLYANPRATTLVASMWFPRSEAVTGADGKFALTVLPGQGMMGAIGPGRDAYMPARITPKEIKAFFKAPLAHPDQMSRAIGGNAASFIHEEHQAVVLLEPDDKEKALVRNIVLEPAKFLTLKGRLVGSDDKPLAGVSIGGWSRRRGDTKTLKTPEFTVEGIDPRAERQLIFFHQEKKLGLFIKKLGIAARGPLVVKLLPCGSTVGRLVDPSGEPVAGGRILVGGVTSEQVGGGYYQLTTDKTGRFRIDGLVPGFPYHIMVKGVIGRIFATATVEPGKQKDLGDIKLLD